MLTEGFIVNCNECIFSQITDNHLFTLAKVPANVYFRLYILKLLTFKMLRFLLNVTINDKRVFNPDGTARKSDLKIVNLRRNASSAGITWEEVRPAGESTNNFTLQQYFSWDIS